MALAKLTVHLILGMEAMGVGVAWIAEDEAGNVENGDFITVTKFAAFVATD